MDAGPFPVTYGRHIVLLRMRKAVTSILGAEEYEGKFRILGIKDADRIISDLWNTVSNPSKVSCNLLQENHVAKIQNSDGNTVVLIRVPRADRSKKPVLLTAIQ